MMNSTEGGSNEGGSDSFEDSEGGDDGDDDKHMVCIWYSPDCDGRGGGANWGWKILKYSI